MTTESWFSHAIIHNFLLTFHRAADSLDAETFCSTFFTDDIEVQYGNQPVTTGRDATKRDFERAFGNLELMKHELVYFDVVGPSSNHGDSTEGEELSVRSAAEEEVRIYQAARIQYVVKGDDVKDMERIFEVPAFLAGWVVRKTLSESGKGTDVRLKFRQMEIYLDVSRVFARMAEKGLL